MLRIVLKKSVTFVWREDIPRMIKYLLCNFRVDTVWKISGKILEYIMKVK